MKIVNFFDFFAHFFDFLQYFCNIFVFRLFIALIIFVFNLKNPV